MNALLVYEIFCVGFIVFGLWLARQARIVTEQVLEEIERLTND